MANTSNPIIKAPNGIVRINSLVGIIKSSTKLHGFDARGNMRMYLDDTTSDEERERIREVAMTRGVYIY